MTHVDQERTTAAVAAQFEAIEALATGLAPDEWHLPTALPGWDVQANVVHVIGTEAMLLGEPAPSLDIDLDGLDHVRNDIGKFNEAWVIAMADASPAEVLDGLRRRIAERIEALAAVTPEAWDAESFTPAGPDTFGRFMRIRVMDMWMHEQDIREAIGQPGHGRPEATEAALDEIVTALGYVVGKRAGAPDGSSVTFDLTGEGARRVHVAVDGRAGLVDSLPGAATVTLRMPTLTLTRLAGGRSTDTSKVDVTGDADLAQKVLANLAFMI